ncbi:MAG TPA: T9SS type A sorting domain-containing protein, partial [Panacibacter sp.]|nr:T9SS type A sorting domain-containing protein [Panacibacter sp.]
YNLLRDGEDWYKITTTLDGMIGLTMTSGNGQYVQVWLYDKDGTTQLNYMAPSGTQTVYTDGLAAGTYYVKIGTYYSNGYIPYTLSNTFTPYTYTNDGASEPNDAAYQAKTIPANGNVTGHVNFYQNVNTRNTTDWWKINYTGSGNLTINLYDELWKINGINHYKQIWVYKDTTASSIYYTAPYGDATINLTSLTQGYYWIKVTSYYGGEHIAYKLSNTFTQVTKAKIISTVSDTSLVCDSLNSITFKCSKSQAPYTVQLKRYGVNYGSSVIVSKSNVTFSNLPPGSYSATALGDGATGNTFGKSDTVALVPTPAGTFTNGVNATTTKTNWTILPCVKYYTVQYRKTGDITWISVNTVGNVGLFRLTGLTAATSYEWQVQAVDSGANGLLAKSAFTASLTFTTAAAAFADNNNSESSATAANGNTKGFMAYPNPAATQFRIQYTTANLNEKVSVLLKDVNGKTVWNKNNTVATSVNGTFVDVSKLSPGIYMLQVISENNAQVLTQKIVVSR